ncbi:MAG: VCBS repeat-containing protein [bacterium]
MKKKAILTLMIIFGILTVINAEAFEPLFDAPTDYSTGDNLNYMVAGDLNQDGYPDLAVTNEIEMTVSIFMNKKDGTFSDAVKYEVGKRPQSIVLGDFNQDGYPDFVTANRLSTRQLKVLSQAARLSC